MLMNWFKRRKKKKVYVSFLTFTKISMYSDTKIRDGFVNFFLNIFFFFYLFFFLSDSSFTSLLYDLASWKICLSQASLHDFSYPLWMV